MNGEVQDFIARIVEQYPIAGHVLEIGSLDICGSPKRWFTANGDQKTPTDRFPKYVGIDIVSGNLVDVVVNVHELNGWKEAFDVVITTSQLEHDTDPFATMSVIANTLKSGGWLIFTAPSWRGEGPHDQHDYWRFMKEGVELLMARAGIEIVELIDHAPSNDIMVLGRRRYNARTQTMNIPTFDEAMVLTSTISNIHILQLEECAAMYDVLCLLPTGSTLIEVGCDVGRSSSLISQFAAVKGFLTIHVDPWEEFIDRAKDWMGNVAERCAWHQFIVLHMTTEQAATHIRRLTQGGVDFAFIDGCHDQHVVERDLEIVASRVKPGGFLLAHDYPSAGVAEAIDPYVATGWIKYKQAQGLGIWRRDGISQID